MTSKRKLRDRIDELEEDLRTVRYDFNDYRDKIAADTGDHTRRLLKTAEDVSRFWEARAKEREKERDVALNDLRLMTEQRDAFERQAREMRLKESEEARAPVRPAPGLKRGRR